MKTTYTLIFCFVFAILSSAQTKNDQLFQAVQNNEIEKADVLLKAGCDANYIKVGSPYMEITPLIAAVHNKNKLIVELLLKNQVNVNWKDNTNTSAIIYAASLGNLEMVKLLSDHGANLNDSNKEGKTVLKAAKESKNAQLVAYIENQNKEQK